MKHVRSSSPRLRVVVVLGRVVMIVAAAFLVGTCAAVGAAAWTATPAVFLGAGLAATAVVAAGASKLWLPQQVARPHRVGALVAVGLDRDVADLEQIRQLLGADKMVLVGHSSGALLAASYLAAHPARVDRLVLTSPAPLDPADHSTDRPPVGSPCRSSCSWRLVLRPAPRSAICCPMWRQIVATMRFWPGPRPVCTARTTGLTPRSSTCPTPGHDIYQDQPAQVLTVTRSFLTDQPPPIASYTPTDPPPDYQHP